MILPTFRQQGSVILLRKLCLRDAELVHTLLGLLLQLNMRVCNAHVAALIRLASNCMLTFWEQRFSTSTYAEKQSGVPDFPTCITHDACMRVIACTHLDIMFPLGVNTCPVDVMYPVVLVWTSNCDKVMPSAKTRRHMPCAVFARVLRLKPLNLR